MLDFSPPMHVARHEQRQAVAGCRAVRGSRVGGERGHLAVRGGAGRTRAARRALRAETVGGSGGGVDRGVSLARERSGRVSIKAQSKSSGCQK